MSTFTVRFFNLSDETQGTVFGPFSEVAISDDGESIKADGQLLARQFDGEWAPYPWPWETWSEVSIGPYQAGEE